MGWVMQELVYSLNYVLECMDLMRSGVDIEVEKVSICVICAVRTVKVVYGSARSSECEDHGPSATATI